MPYDRFGNRKFDVAQTTPSSVLGPQLDFSANTNRITTTNYHYDRAGNVDQEPASPNNKSYAYDGENDLLTCGNSLCSITILFFAKKM